MGEKNTTIARLSLPEPGGAGDLERMRSAVQQLEEKCHLLVTPQMMVHIPDGFRVFWSQTWINTDPEVGDVFSPTKFAKKGETLVFKPEDKVCLTAGAISKIATDAGLEVDVVPLHTGGRSYFWSFKATATGYSITGEKRSAVAIVELDYGEEWLASQTETTWVHNKPVEKPATSASKNVVQMRKVGSRVCATFAERNARRKWLGLRTSYTVQELREKPFVVSYVKWVPDTSNPQLRAFLDAQALGIKAQLYAQPSAAVAQLAASDPDEDEREMEAAALRAELAAAGATLDADFEEVPPKAEPKAVPDIVCPQSLGELTVEKRVELLEQLVKTTNYDFVATMATSGRPSWTIGDLVRKGEKSAERLYERLVELYDQMIEDAQGNLEF